jgi:DNA-binding GntR family transcriptional regulator
MTKPDGEAPSLRVGRVAAPLREQVLDRLREAILTFQFKPGQRLIERELIDQTGVSRTTIREVLRELAAEGLVATIPQKGAIVVIPSMEEAAEIYEVRAALEGLAARRFVQFATPERFAELQRALEDFERVVEEHGDIQTMLASKDRLYDALLAGSGNSTIASVLGGLQARVRVLRAASLSRPGRPEAAAEELRALVAAIEARDGDEAARLCAAHISHAARSGMLAHSVGESLVAPA